MVGLHTRVLYPQRLTHPIGTVVERPQVPCPLPPQFANYASHMLISDTCLYEGS